jgi:hypothetical protein
LEANKRDGGGSKNKAVFEHGDKRLKVKVESAKPKFQVQSNSMNSEICDNHSYFMFWNCFVFPIFVIQILGIALWL